MWSGRRLTNIQTTSRPDTLWPEVWTKIGKAAQNREKQEWAKEKPKLDNARKLRECTSSIRMTQSIHVLSNKRKKKLERPMAPAMPCNRDNQHLRIVKTKIMQNNVHMGRSSKRFVVVWCNLTSPRDREQNLGNPHDMKIALLGKEFTSMTHYYLVHKFFSMPQEMKIPGAKAAVDKEWKNLETIPEWDLEKVKSKKGGYSGSTKRQKTESTLLH